jgi:predicted nucleic acid-binding protein
MRQGDVFYIPEVVDYELRRELLHLGFADSVARLDALKSAVGYMPITTATMLKAAELWASARRAGIPTADVKALDVDMILSAHTILLGALVGSAPIVATTNVRHLSQFVDARRWQDIV